MRLAAPLLQDYVYIANRMRPDEIAQFLSVAGLSEYEPDIAARSFAAIPGVAHALIDDAGYPVLLGGHEEVRPGVWQGWLMGTMEGWERHGFAISRVCRRLQDRLMESEHCHRVQLYATADRKPAHVWYERALGMTYEGTHRAYFADGSDALCFARVKEARHGR